MFSTIYTPHSVEIIDPCRQKKVSSIRGLPYGHTRRNQQMAFSEASEPVPTDW